MTIKKAIILVAGVGTRFLPLSKSVPKELWPLVDEPIVQRIIAEARDSGIEEILFVTSPGNKKILDYLKPSLEIESILKPVFLSLDLVKLQTLNGKIVVEGQDAGAVAEEYLKANNFLK